jgi:hypothetical protein
VTHAPTHVSAKKREHLISAASPDSTTVPGTHPEYQAFIEQLRQVHQWLDRLGSLPLRMPTKSPDQLNRPARKGAKLIDH